MALFSENFVGCYPVSKTLKFELRPVPETKAYLDDDNCPLLAGDFERDKAYPVVKELLDKYYRYFIDVCLRDRILSTATIDAAYKAYVAHDEKSQKALKAASQKLRKEVAGFFDKKTRETYCLDKYSNLLVLDKKNDSREKGAAKTIPSVLKKWLENESGFSEKEVEKYSQAVQTFNGFTTYFISYKETRENMFSSEEKASAISYRVVNQNMLRFFSNVENFENIKKKYPDLYQTLKKFEKSFVPAAYGSLLSQAGIDDYNNRVIGRPAEDEDFAGVNRLINEYRQKNAVRNRDLPVMVTLYKQILSDRENGFGRDILASDSEAKEYIRGKYSKAYDTACQLTAFVNNYILTEDLDTVYVKTQHLKDISQSVFGEWSVLDDAISNGGIDSKIISLKALAEAFEEYCGDLDPDTAKKYREAFSLKEYLKNPPAVKPRLPETGEKVTAYKPAMDELISLIRFYKPFYLYDGKKRLQVPAEGMDFSNEFDKYFEDLREFSPAYDRVRNFATKKPYSVEKIKLNFNNPNLLNGWDVNRESANASFLFEKEGKYYLGIAEKGSGNIFDLSRDAVKEALTCGEDYYEKVQYKQLPNIRMNLPRIVFKPKWEKVFAPIITDRISAIEKEKLYTAGANDRQAVIEWIDFVKSVLALHPEWNNYFQFKFKETSAYKNTKEFYDDLDNQAYILSKIKINASYIHKLVRERKLYLFQIYCKDFSDKKKKTGADNLHTMYWKCLFSDENLAALAQGQAPIIKLNGKAEIFLREPSLKYEATHPKNQPVANKNPLNSKRESLFSYDLAKDRRFTERKLFFHCPLTINFRTAAEGARSFNERVNQFVENNPDIRIIGIDRGERHLLYYTVINQSGKILEQGSLNKISSDYRTPEGAEVEKVTDYHELLDRKEGDRRAARQTWDTIENIKELKEGYLSQVVHKLTTLMIKHNAVVVLENLNLNFKRSRTKVEKQVYQKFEKALIDKLNYLVFKDRPYGVPGSYANGLQLTAPFESFDRLGKQTGALYYVVPSYTSHIDPKTGFVNLLGAKLRYESVVKAQETMKKIGSFKFNPERNWFEISFDYGDFGIEMAHPQWTACTHGDAYWGYNPKEKRAVSYDVTEEIKKLLTEYGIDYGTGADIKEAAIRQTNPAFWKTLFYMLKLALQLRNTVAGTDNENDYILSPVEYEAGKFFDSRKAGEDEPQNADANGAYHIAMKGLQALRRIEDGKVNKFPENGERKAWLAFMQNREYLK